MIFRSRVMTLALAARICQREKESSLVIILQGHNCINYHHLFRGQNTLVAHLLVIDTWHCHRGATSQQSPYKKPGPVSMPTFQHIRPNRSFFVSFRSRPRLQRQWKHIVVLGLVWVKKKWMKKTGHEMSNQWIFKGLLFWGFMLGLASVAQLMEWLHVFASSPS